MAAAKVLSDQDFELLRKFVLRLRSQNLNKASVKDVDVEGESQAAGMYLALPRESRGIPGIAHCASIPGEGDVAGSAECDIFRIVSDGTIIPTGLSETVYNFSTSVIPRMFVPIDRTDHGLWVASLVEEVLEGVLMKKLEPATGPFTGATMSYFAVMERSGDHEYGDDGEIEVPADWSLTAKVIKIINRSVSLQGSPGAYGRIKNLGGEFRGEFFDCAVSEEGVHSIIDIYSDTFGGFVYGG